MSGNAAWLPANLLALVKQSSGASAVQHTCAVLQDTCVCCLHAYFGSKPKKACSGTAELVA